jgi:hypothetical protein
MTQALYVAQSSNRKTGNIPQQFVGRTLEESRASCVGCALFDSVCYAQHGTPALGHASAIRAAKRGRNYSLETALQNRHPNARAVRLGANGDPSALGRREYTRVYRTIRNAGLGIRSYTHFWASRGSWLRGRALASTETLRDALMAVKLGWRTALVIDSRLTRTQLDHLREAFGIRAANCPAQVAPGSVTCNDCRLCDPEHRGIDIVLFEQH